MRILSVAAEVAPFSKSGGLGDVGAALPRALAARGHHVVTVSPSYRGAADARGHWSLRGEYWFWLFGQQHQARYLVWEETDKLEPNRFFHRLAPLGSYGMVAIGGANRKDGHLDSCQAISLN